MGYNSILRMKKTFVYARATEIKQNYRTGFYWIDIYHDQKLIAAMEAVSYRKDHYFIELDEQD